MEPTKKVMPSPQVMARPLSNKEMDNLAGFKPLNESQVWTIIHKVAEGVNLIDACKEQNTNIGSLRLYAREIPRIGELIRQAKKIRAERLGELSYEEVRSQLSKMKGRPLAERSNIFNKLYKYIERQTALDDSDQDLKMKQVKQVTDSNKKAIEKPLVIKESWAEQAKGYDLASKRVDAPDKPEEDQYVSLGDK